MIAIDIPGWGNLEIENIVCDLNGTLAEDGKMLLGVKEKINVSLALALVLSSVAFALIGILISVEVREVFEAMTMANFFRFPMVFLCGVFFPVTAMPMVLRIIGFCLPFTYSVDALRQSLLPDGGLLHRWVDLLILAGFT